jgi:hypothetical protein
MIKTFVLIIMSVVNGQTFTAPATYYDTMEECNVRMSRIMSQQYPFPVRAFCAETIPPVEGQ